MSVDDRGASVKVARLEGDYDVTRARELREVLGTVLGESACAVIDCSGVTYFDSIGIAELVHLYKALRASGDTTKPRLVIALPGLRRIFEVAGLDKVFDIYDDMESATAGLRMDS